MVLSGLDLAWIWSGFDLDLTWIWSGCDLDLIWIWSGFNLDLIWMWSGCDLDVIWMWSECDLDVTWMWSGCDLNVIWIWSGFDLDLKWKLSGIHLDLNWIHQDLVRIWGGLVIKFGMNVTFGQDMKISIGIWSGFWWGIDAKLIKAMYYIFSLQFNFIQDLLIDIHMPK